MNNRFYLLPIEKQKRIINAAYKVFAENSYKKAPMSEIASVGNISKALLFHYFTNKKELYLYLWNYAMELTKKTAKEHHVLETNNFFEILKRNLFAKCSLMREYPHIYAFSIKAYYEEYPEIKCAIQKSYLDISHSSEVKMFDKIDISIFRTDIDLRLMYTEITYAIDGYLLKKYRSASIAVDEIEQEITSLIGFWEQVYTTRGN